MSIKTANKDRNDLIIIPQCKSFIYKPSSGKKAIHEEIEIKYFYKGTSTLLIGNNIINACAGDIVVINPYEFHTTVNVGEEKGHYHTFMVPLDYFSEPTEYALNLRTFSQVQGKSFKNLVKNNSELAVILEHIVDEYEKKDEAYYFFIRGLMMEFFALLARCYVDSNDECNFYKNSFRNYTLIEPALRHIRDNYKSEITIEELAGLCNMSKYYFCHVFKSVTEKSCMEYLREHRLKLASIMLKTSDANINFISKQCGFENVNYFCRSYKKYYGVSPGHHRESYE